MANILTNPLKDFPESIRAGDTIKVERSDFNVDYPPSTFTAKFRARKIDAGNLSFDVLQLRIMAIFCSHFRIL